MDRSKAIGLLLLFAWYPTWLLFSSMYELVTGSSISEDPLAGSIVVVIMVVEVVSGLMKIMDDRS